MYTTLAKSWLLYTCACLYHHKYIANTNKKPSCCWDSRSYFSLVQMWTTYGIATDHVLEQLAKCTDLHVKFQKKFPKPQPADPHTGWCSTDLPVGSSPLRAGKWLRKNLGFFTFKNLKNLKSPKFRFLFFWWNLIQIIYNLIF